MKFLTNLDLLKNQLLNAIAQNVASDPETGLVEGWVIYNTTDHTFKYYNGTQWVPLTDSPEITVETTIGDSSTNTNPVGPKAVYDSIIDVATAGQILKVQSDGSTGKEVIGVSVDNTATENSTNLISSGAVFADIAAALAKIFSAPANGELLVKHVTTDQQTGEVISVTCQGISIDNAVASSATGVPSTAAVASAIAAIQSMEFKGTVDSTGTITSSDTDIDGSTIMSLTDFTKGWTFVVSGTLTTAVSGFSTQLNSGDMIITLASTDQGFDPANFSLVQKNMDGVVMGPSSSTNNNLPVFDGATGVLLKDSGILITDLASAVTFANPALTAVSGQCTWTITHNKETRNIICKIYNSSWEEVVADVTLTSTSAITVTINSATDIAADTYHAVLVGNVVLPTPPSP